MHTTSPAGYYTIRTIGRGAGLGEEKKDLAKRFVRCTPGVSGYGPQVPQIDFNLLKWFGSEFRGCFKCPQQRPTTRFKPIDFQDHLPRIDQPKIRNFMLSIFRHLLHAVQACGTWGKDFASPVGNDWYRILFPDEPFCFPSCYIGNTGAASSRESQGASGFHRGWKALLQDHQ